MELPNQPVLSLDEWDQQVAETNARMFELEKQYEKELARQQWLAERDLRLSQGYRNPRMMAVHPWFRGQP